MTALPPRTDTRITLLPVISMCSLFISTPTCRYLPLTLLKSERNDVRNAADTLFVERLFGHKYGGRAVLVENEHLVGFSS